VYTSNIFAILGLRTLYFTLAAMVHRFTYLKYALALVLIFIGAKIFLGDFVFGGKVPAALSLSVTIGLLLGGHLQKKYRLCRPHQIRRYSVPSLDRAPHWQSYRRW